MTKPMTTVSMEPLIEKPRPAISARRCAALLAILLFVFTGVTMRNAASAAVTIQQGGQLPAGHPEIGMGSPAVNPKASKALMEMTNAIQSENRSVFRKKVNLSALRMMAVQDRDQVKTMDSWAREVIERICGHASINKENPLYTAVDMAFRPEAWDTRPCIYIQVVPLRKRIALLMPRKSRQAFIERGTVSPEFLEQSDVQRTMRHVADNDNRFTGAVNQVQDAIGTYADLRRDLNLLPPPMSHPHRAWYPPLKLGGRGTRTAPDAAGHVLIKLPGYSGGTLMKITLATQEFFQGWRYNNVGMANRGIAALASDLPLINPPAYPSRFKREVEIWYNKLFDGTIVGVFLYFVALTLFLIAAVGAAPAVGRYAFAFFTLAVLMHATFMATRWWLAGRIPIQNEFESVLGSAFVGCVAGWFLERWKRNNLFGLAFSAVGFLAMTACFVTPYVFGENIGENIGKVKGILSSYWLYMHVNVVISSYALIGASFVLGLVYLGCHLWYINHPVPEAGGDAALIDSGSDGGYDSGGDAGGGGAAIAVADRPRALGLQGNLTNAIAIRRERFLEQLDAANIVVLQMAFWFLGTGIFLGAVWADYSWGRPWGWDPKETFALVTWIVYLIIVHLRFVTPKYRANWTAWLSVIGFGVMMFNWIGVNFYLVGLHSYA